MKEFIITRNDAGQTVLKFLQKVTCRLPKGALFKALRKKDIKLNGSRCYAGDTVSEGDRLSVFDDRFFEKKQAEDFLLAGNTLDIVYEDENILIADKPPGLIVHAGSESGEDNLINRIKRYLYEKGEYDPALENTFAPALCNRLDRNTGGLVIAAKNSMALQEMNAKIKAHNLEKRYLCLVDGIPPKDHDTLKGFMLKNHAENKMNVLSKPAPQAKEAVTKYRTVKRFGARTLLEIDLISGRSHQIRAHMASLGCPITGDIKYGAKKIPGHYQALYAYSLTFRFGTDSGVLSYLDGKTVKAHKIWFENGL